MPFFGGSRRHEPAPAPVPEPQSHHTSKRGGLFHRSQPEPEPVYRAPVHSTHHDTKKKGGLFNRRTSSPDEPRISSSSSGSSSYNNHHNSGIGKRGGSLLRRNKDHDWDPSIVAAKERVLSAEAAEAEADRALDTARLSARDARAEMRRLEMEAKEDARRAKIKQHQAGELSKRGKGLGRHGL